jgi:formiminotetrahydrofolate cyclodeaminase
VTDDHLFALPLEQILTRTAERTPYPGGGAACAAACASAAALVAMVARFGDEPATLVAEAEAAVIELGRLADDDAEAFGELLAAWQLPSDEPSRGERVAAASTRASEVPLRVCRLGAAMAVHATRLAIAGKPDLRGDAYTGAYLCHAAVCSAARLVEINARQAADHADADEARSLADQTQRAVEELTRAGR